MRLLAFCVRDVKAEYFSSPFYTRSLGEALRGFGDEARNPESQLFKHPHDFVLFHIGHFDQQTGELDPIDPFSYGSAYEHGRVEQQELAPETDRYKEVMNASGPSDPSLTKVQ